MHELSRKRSHPRQNQARFVVFIRLYLKPSGKQFFDVFGIIDNHFGKFGSGIVHGIHFTIFKVICAKKYWMYGHKNGFVTSQHPGRTPDFNASSQNGFVFSQVHAYCVRFCQPWFHTIISKLGSRIKIVIFGILTVLSYFPVTSEYRRRIEAHKIFLQPL